MLLVLCAFTSNAMAQWVGNGTSASPWQIGDGQTNTASAVTAVLNGNTLTISGTGNMADFMYSTEGEAPWNYQYYSNSSSITNVVIQSGVTNIGDRAFHDLKNLQQCTIPNTVTQIGKEAFYMEHVTNTSFRSVTIPNSVNYVEGRAFMNCSGLETVDIQNGKTDITFLPTTAAVYYYDDHFTGCSSLKTLHIGRQLVLGDGFTGVNPFSLNPYIQSLTIGNTVIYPINFSGCTALKEVILEDGTEDFDFQNETFSSMIFNNCPIQILYLGRNIINCSVFGSGTSPFANNTTLTTVTIGNNVKSIIDESFNGCTNLASVSIPSSVTFIGQGAFYQCAKLTSITIPSSVTSIGYQAFAGCNGLTQIICQNPNPPSAFDKSSFYNEYATPLYVPAASLSLYQNATEWKNFFTILPTGINEVITSQLSIYPNPVKDNLFIKSDLQITKIEICSLEGSLLMQENNFKGKISVSALPHGIYLLKVFTDKGVIVSRIVKE